MATLWKYAMTCVVTNPAFASQVYQVLMDSLPQNVRGNNADTFNANSAMRDTTLPGNGPDAWVIHSSLQQLQFDEMTEFLAEGTPARWLSAGLQQAQINTFRSQIECNIGLFEQINSEHSAYLSSLNLVSQG